jgi:glycosyltransferase involved in cell wall biosynthesis
MERICVVIPAFNDWESVQRLVADLGSTGLEHGVRYELVVVDDSSTSPAPADWPSLEHSAIGSLEIVRLACNVGHQRAIAIGLVTSREKVGACTGVVVMDGDGEDRPIDISELLKSSAANPGSIVCARRARRSEPLPFRIFYRLYKFVFGQLTGTHIDFGNFCLIPASTLRAVVSQAGIWNHLAATLVRSRLPLLKIDTMRGKRYAGQSKMNFVSLVLHGLSAVAVFADVALVRIALLAMLLAGFAFAGILATTAVRVFTPWAIPGWASGVAGTLAILLFQAVLTPGIGLFVVLSQRTARTVVPLKDAPNFVESVRVVYARSDA